MNSKRLLHVGFKISLLVKGIDGILEIVVGALFVFLNPMRVNAIVTFLTKHEITEDPKDLLANWLLNMSHSFSVESQTFVIIYLILHGLVKVFMVYFLYKKKLWAYPAGIVFLLTFIGYQIHRYTYGHSIFMILLTVFDTIMVGLVYNEYKHLKRSVDAV